MVVEDGAHNLERDRVQLRCRYRYLVEQQGGLAQLLRAHPARQSWAQGCHRFRRDPDWGITWFGGSKGGTYGQPIFLFLVRRARAALRVDVQITIRNHYHACGRKIAAGGLARNLTGEAVASTTRRHLLFGRPVPTAPGGVPRPASQSWLIAGLGTNGAASRRKAESIAPVVSGAPRRPHRDEWIPPT